MTYGYPNLHASFGWNLGIHKAPAGYEHTWLIVGNDETVGSFSRAEARYLWKRHKNSGIPLSLIRD